MSKYADIDNKKNKNHRKWIKIICTKLEQNQYECFRIKTNDKKINLLVLLFWRMALF